MNDSLHRVGYLTMNMKNQKIPKLVKDDPWLEPYTDEIADRIVRYNDLVKTIKAKSKSLKSFGWAFSRVPNRSFCFFCDPECSNGRFSWNSFVFLSEKMGREKF